MVAAQSAPAPPRRNRGGRPAGCSAIVLAWLFAFVLPAHAAVSPSPDPAPTHVQPDAAPGSQTPSAPAQRPVTRTPAYTPTVTQQVVPTPSPATTNPASPTPRSAPTAQRTSRTPAHAKPKPKPRPHAGRHAPPARPQLPAAIGAARREAGIRAAYQPGTSSPALSDGDLVAAATLLLLFVAAAASVLRLSARMDDDVGPGRLGW
jgi:hypothetical protein